MTSKRDSRSFVLALAPDASASTRLPCLAYINVPLSTYCRIRYVSKFTAASRCSPCCNSTAFLFTTKAFASSFYSQTSGGSASEHVASTILLLLHLQIISKSVVQIYSLISLPNPLLACLLNVIHKENLTYFIVNNKRVTSDL